MGNGCNLAHDMLTPVVYGIDVRIVLDNSGSMQLDMLGRVPDWGSGMDAVSPPSQILLQQVLRSALPARRGIDPPVNLGDVSPFNRRWYQARDALMRWLVVFQVLGLDPWVYLLNSRQIGRRVRLTQIHRIFGANLPSGSTPMTEALTSAFTDEREANSDHPLLVLVLTDGEADNMLTFNTVLDKAQNGVYGDVQVCLLGLSLVKEDIEWFENEECDETRIRTVEPFEVEQRQIQLREVVRKEGAYNFAMHTYRVLVTNFFPADYDYEAPLQNLRHRLYISLHGRDRWYAINSCIWKFFCSGLACSGCYLATCCHGCGWCQGSECCSKTQKPEWIEACCVGEE